MNDARTPPAGPLTPRPGDDGYVSTLRVVAELRIAVDTAREYLAPRPQAICSVEGALRVLDGVAVLARILNERVARCTLRDVDDRDVPGDPADARDATDG